MQEGTTLETYPDMKTTHVKLTKGLCMILIASLLVLAPPKRAKAEPVEIGIAIALLVGTIAGAIYEATQPKHNYTFKYSCSDKNDSSGILIFTDKNYPNDALRVTLTRGSISGFKPVQAVPVINRWDPNWAFVAENGTDLTINTQNPAQATFSNAKGDKSMPMTCSTTRPSKQTLEKWTMTDADRAQIARYQEENRGPKTGTIYESGTWDQAERAPAAQTQLK